MQSSGLKALPTPGGQKLKAQNQSLWIGPSNVQVFLRCLRLLDLDRRDDWPGLVEDHFAAKQNNLNRRIKGVEWSLYRLFELWDAEETRNKLRPFFPPLASLQSINLRAALFRCLTDLKKNGVLSKDSILRKSMLDECKGDKFEEILAKFALAVLRKATNVYEGDKLQSNQWRQGQHKQVNLLPLVLAHRYSLQMQLQRRAARKREYDNVQQALKDMANDLAISRQKLPSRSQLQKDAIQEAAAEWKQRLEQAWIGDETWIDLIVNGESDAASMSPTTSSFDNFLQYHANACKSGEVIRSNNLLADLNERVAKHNSRLHEWNAFRRELEQKKVVEAAPLARKHIVKGSNFADHKSLKFDPQTSALHPENGLKPSCLHYQNLVQEMEMELTAARGGKSEVGIRELRQSKPKKATVASDGHSDKRFRKTPSLTKPTAQIKDSAYGNGQSANENELSPYSPTGSSPKEDVEIKTNQLCPKYEPKPVRLETQHKHKPVEDQIGTNKTTANLPGELFGNETHITAMTAPSSLAENTPHQYKTQTPVPDHGRPSRQSSISMETLIQRTRQSMSLLPNQPNTANEKRKRTSTAVKPLRQSHIFPINQFETPPKAHATESPQSGESTPKEQLFSESADYASVFKSRPRIATSPNVSPEGKTLGFDSSLLDGLEDDVISEVEELTLGSSPLRSRNAQ
ncbi:MAG: hypothetical protein Q9227_004863 [Pyrenula ochraceoflavens]